MTDLPYQQLKIWQKGMNLVDAVYGLTKYFPKEEMFGITSQMRRSAVSIPSNIAEGSQRATQKDFAMFVLYAKGSLVELETQLLISVRQKMTDAEKIDALLLKTNELGKMLRAFHKAILSKSALPTIH